MKPGPSEMDSRREGTGNTGEILVSRQGVGRGIWCQPKAECTLAARDGWCSLLSFHILPALAS